MTDTTAALTTAASTEDVTGDPAELVVRLCAGVAAGGAGPRSAVFRGRVDLTEAAQRAVRAHGGRLCQIDCTTAGVDSLVPLRPVIDAVLPGARERSPGLVDRFAPELVALHPDLAAELALPPRRWLGHLANTPSERRSHRESELLFRMVNGLAAFLHQAHETEPGLLVLNWRELHTADAATLLAFRRICRWANLGETHVVCLATLDPAGSRAVPQPALPVWRTGAFDWARWHRSMVDKAVEQSRSVLVRVDGGAGDRAAAAVVGPTPVADAIGMLAVDLERGCALAVRAMGNAAFMLDYPVVMLLAGHVLARLTQAPAFDRDRFLAEWAASAPVEHYVALEFASVRPENRADVLASAWRAAGFANTCLGDHEAALRCYRSLLKVCGTPERRARAYMYLGLIAGKRLRRIAEAEQYLMAGMAEIDGRTDPACVLERSWLLNVRALMAFQQRDTEHAMALIREARELMRQLHFSEATHLKINLVSNVSMLYELTGRAERAAQVWQQFAAFLGPANELFAKHYYFREGALRLLAGRTEDAFKSFLDSYAQCEAVDDPFYAAIVARACGFTSYRLGRFAQAGYWYARAAANSEACGDHEALPHDRAVAAFVAGGGPAGPDPVDRVPMAPAPPWTKLNRPFSLVNLYGLDEAE